MVNPTVMFRSYNKIRQSTVNTLMTFHDNIKKEMIHSAVEWRITKEVVFELKLEGRGE